MRYSISNAIPHNPKSEKHPYENLVNTSVFGVFMVELITGLEPVTSSLPRMCSTT